MEKKIPAKSPENREKSRERAIRNIIEGKFEVRPTKPESEIIKITKRFNLPYKYVGDGAFWINKMNPDFINTNHKKIAIEVLGDYWHNDEEFEERAEKLSEYGYRTLGIYESTMRGHTDMDLVSTIINFEKSDSKFMLVKREEKVMLP